MIFTEAARPRRIPLLGIDKSLCLPKLKSITDLLYDLLTMNENYLLSLMFNLIKTFSQILATVIEIV